ncbi:hypothetical protein pipiens_015317 [Culex pipiens pipiens]|uniref:Ig-like domain-containing protein n=1 Tax=Culex pipiens pipiens TaxID=38569 RepID=A0ABD1CQZ6_CULPP
MCCDSGEAGRLPVLSEDGVDASREIFRWDMGQSSTVTNMHGRLEDQETFSCVMNNNNRTDAAGKVPLGPGSFCDNQEC